MELWANCRRTLPSHRQRDWSFLPHPLFNGKQLWKTRSTDLSTMPKYLGVTDSSKLRGNSGAAARDRLGFRAFAYGGLRERLLV
jgi:hypothetical protein